MSGRVEQVAYERLSALGKAAIEYARLGFRVFPLVPNTKDAFKGSRAIHDATINEFAIYNWWNIYPDANIGFHLNASRAVAIDADTYKSECQWWDFIQSRTLPETLTQVTPNGGTHFIFLAQPGDEFAGTLCDKVDIRHNHYILLPPSVVNGRKYAWSNWIEPSVRPDWLPRKRVKATPKLQVPWDREKELPRLKALLTGIPADCDYEEWYRCIAAVHHHTGGDDDGLELVADWSATGGVKYKGYGDVARKFRAVANMSQITVGTLELIAARYRGRAACFPFDPSAYEARFGPLRPLPGEPFETASLAGQPVPERRFLDCMGFIPHRGVTLLYGDGGTGKSLIAMQLLAAVALDKPWLNVRLTASGNVFYFAAEDAIDELHIRADAVARSYGATLSDLKGLVIAPMAGRNCVLGAANAQSVIAPTDLFNTLKKTMQRDKPELIVIDNAVDVFAGDQNNASHVKQFMHLLTGLSIDADCPVLLLAHPSRAGMQTGTGDGGSVHWSNSARSRLYLNRVVGSDGYEANTNARLLQLMKSNYAASGQAINMRYRDGVFHADSLDDVTLKPERVFLQLLEQHEKANMNVSPNVGPTYGPIMFAKHVDADGVTRQHFEHAMQRLIEQRRIVIIEDGPPSKRRKRLASNTYRPMEKPNEVNVPTHLPTPATDPSDPWKSQ